MLVACLGSMKLGHMRIAGASLCEVGGVLKSAIHLQEAHVELLGLRRAARATRLHGRMLLSLTDNLVSSMAFDAARPNRIILRVDGDTDVLKCERHSMGSDSKGSGRAETKSGQVRFRGTVDQTSVSFLEGPCRLFGSYCPLLFSLPFADRAFVEVVERDARVSLRHRRTWTSGHVSY